MASFAEAGYRLRSQPSAGACSIAYAGTRRCRRTSSGARRKTICCQHRLRAFRDWPESTGTMLLFGAAGSASDPYPIQVDSGELPRKRTVPRRKGCSSRPPTVLLTSLQRGGSPIQDGYRSHKLQVRSAEPRSDW